MKKKLFLDDVRDPPDDSWLVVRNYADFKRCIISNPPFDVIAFDHDLSGVLLGTELTGYDCAKLCVEWLKVPRVVIVHSHNPVGAERIMQVFKYTESKVVRDPYPMRLLLGNTDNGFKGTGSIRPSTSN
jgi:hypothetical protein